MKIIRSLSFETTGLKLKLHLGLDIFRKSHKSVQFFNFNIEMLFC